MDDSSFSSPAAKRPRLVGPRRSSNTSSVASSGTENNGADAAPALPLSLSALVERRRWEEALERVQLHPEEARPVKNPSPLALSCRLGAPLQLVEKILQAAPEKLRHVLDSRGTPIHEAIVCEVVGPQTIQALLRVDESLPIGENEKRATLCQDVDGFTPLHLLIRRRFQSHILGMVGGDRNNNNRNGGQQADLMQILEMLVRSCPQAVVIPDLGEYEEPPIVYAIKATIYAPAILTLEDDNDDTVLARVERQIYEMVSIMLRYCPQAASRIFSGYRGQYTALHSAVFHGRMTNTIELLLRTEAQHNQTMASMAAAQQAQQLEQQEPPPQPAALLGNTQGEIPLHFCAMRGERPRTVALIAHAAPQAVLQRDATGLTPLHWLWVRFVSNLLALDHSTGSNNHGGANMDTVGDATITLPPPLTSRPDDDHHSDIGTPPWNYVDFTCLELGDFDRDMALIKRMDPPVDFLRMRHIPTEVLGLQDSNEWARRSVQVLESIRSRYKRQQEQQQQAHGDDDADSNVQWNRRQVVTSLFWTKVVSLLTAANTAMTNEAGGDHKAPQGESILVHSAFRSPSCLPAVSFMVASLFPEELMRPDDRGRLPLHYAASRPWHAWDYYGNNNNNRPNAGAAGANNNNNADAATPTAGAKLLQGESFAVLRQAIDMSPPEAFRVKDNANRLVLHQVIDTLVAVAPQAAGTSSSSSSSNSSNNNNNQENNTDNNENNNNNATSAPGSDCHLLQLLNDVVKVNPESLQIPDGRTGLYPFLQATAVGTEQYERKRRQLLEQGGVRQPDIHQQQPQGCGGGGHFRCCCACCPFRNSKDDDLSLSITFQLLRENPTLLSTAVSSSATSSTL